MPNQQLNMDGLSDAGLKDCWEGKSSIGNWPLCIYFDIANYLTNIDIKLGRRLLPDYKEGKAYRCLSQAGWVKYFTTRSPQKTNIVF